MTAKLKAPPIPPTYADSISRSIWTSSLRQEGHFQFFHRMLTETLDSLKQRAYTNFDAQTTSNCCHGLSVLVRRLILTLLPQLPHLNSLLTSLDPLEPLFIGNLPDELIDLTSIYILTLIVELDPQKGRRTSPRKLKSKGHLGTAFCEKIVKDLQRKISTFVAESYHDLSTLPHSYNWLGKTSITNWKKFVHDDYLRTDQNGIKYASCMFSMQVVLNHLLNENANIALISDIINPSNLSLSARYVKLFENNKSSFKVMDDISPIKPEDPIIVFGGYTSSEEMDESLLEIRLKPWIYQLQSLILACDMHYPQFPKVRSDQQFNSKPILPTDKTFKETMDFHFQIKGVSAEAPSLFCLSHIFVVSFESIHSLISSGETASFPSCYLPFTP